MECAWGTGEVPHGIRVSKGGESEPRDVVAKDGDEVRKTRKRVGCVGVGVDVGVGPSLLKEKKKRKSGKN